MAKIYEVWDTLTMNRLGSFQTLVAAESLLADVLRVNGVQAATDLAVLCSDSEAPDEEPEIALDGAEFVTTRRLSA